MHIRVYCLLSYMALECIFTSLGSLAAFFFPSSIFFKRERMNNMHMVRHGKARGSVLLYLQEVRGETHHHTSTLGQIPYDPPQWADTLVAAYRPSPPSLSTSPQQSFFPATNIGVRVTENNNVLCPLCSEARWLPWRCPLRGLEQAWVWV